MSKIKNWWNKPWTNGTYVKLCGYGVLVTLIMIVAAGFIGHRKTKELHEETDDLNEDLDSMEMDN